MAYDARVLLDSVAPNGVRLTTLEVTFPRFVLAEFNTHRQFCLDGDTRLYFDLPTKAKGSATRRFTLTIRELYEKWHLGAAPRLNRLKTKGAARVEPPYRVLGAEFIRWVESPGFNRLPNRDRLAAMHLRSCNEDNGEIYHTRVRDVFYSGRKSVFRVTLQNGQAIVASKDHRFLTEDGWKTLEHASGLALSPGKIATWSRSAELAVNGIEAYKDPKWLAGMREVGLSIPRIAKHCGVSVDQIKYQCRKNDIRGWNGTRGKPGTARVRRGAASHLWRGGITPARKSIGASTGQHAFRTHRANNFRCVLCGSGAGLHAHHIDPVAHNPDRACDPTNLTSLCRSCHSDLHRRNVELLLLHHVEAGGRLDSFWSSVEGLRLRKPYVAMRKPAMVRHFVAIKSIEYLGERETYDLEVDGPYHNFVADGFIVHNSRNSASSRAVPTGKLIERVEQEPVIPLEWGRNKAGMSASDVLADDEADAATRAWLAARDDAVKHARELLELKVHKQELNRILEPFLWHTVIVTATEWANFFALRCARNAQPEIRAAALRMREAMDASTPKSIADGQWHTPLIQADEVDLDVEIRKRISAARCARVSYLTHEGQREFAKDLELYERLKSDRHLSPFEHVATPGSEPAFYANFRGWVQMRKEIDDSNAGP